LGKNQLFGFHILTHSHICTDVPGATFLGFRGLSWAFMGFHGLSWKIDAKKWGQVKGKK
jgi:hypothetical protein